MATRLTKNGTEGRVYGGDCDLIHVADGARARMGETLAQALDDYMRSAAVANGARTEWQAYGDEAQPLCPGCYMVVMFNAARTLAERNGQSMSELGRSMARAFARLADDPSAIESIAVELDPQ